MTGIYKITNPKGKIYIGQAKDLERRELDYKYNMSKKQVKLYHSIKKYGWDKHTFEVIELCKWDQLNIRERYWQEHYNVLKEGLNLQLVETSNLPQQHHPDTIGKITSKTRTGVEKLCDRCGKTIYVQQHRIRKYDKHYCSNECSNVDLRKVTTFTCTVCNKDYEVRPSEAKYRKLCDNPECKREGRSRAIKMGRAKRKA